jgi:hypothetical protein
VLLLPFSNRTLSAKTAQETSFEQQINAPALNANFELGYDNEAKGVLVSVNGVVNSPMHLNVQENDTRAECISLVLYYECIAGKAL